MDGAGYEFLPIIVCLSDITVIQYVKIIGTQVLHPSLWVDGGKKGRTIFNLLMDKVKSMKKVWVKINSKFRVKNIVSYQRYHIIWLSYPSPFRVSFLLTPLPCLYFDYFYENSRENGKIPRSEINSFRFCSVIRKPHPGQSLAAEYLPPMKVVSEFVRRGDERGAAKIMKMRSWKWLPTGDSLGSKDHKFQNW